MWSGRSAEKTTAAKCIEAMAEARLRLEVEAQKQGERIGEKRGEERMLFGLVKDGLFTAG